MIRVQVVQRTTKANLCRRAGRSLRVTALHASISPHDRTSAYDAHQLIPKPPPPRRRSISEPGCNFWVCSLHTVYMCWTTPTFIVLALANRSAWIERSARIDNSQVIHLHFAVHLT